PPGGSGPTVGLDGRRARPGRAPAGGCRVRHPHAARTPGRVPVTGLLLALCAATGAFYLYTSVGLGWRGLRFGPKPAQAVRARPGASDWLVQAGLSEVDVRQFGAVTGGLAVAGAVVGLAIFGGPLPALALGACLGCTPLASYRVRRAQRR